MAGTQLTTRQRLHFRTRPQEPPRQTAQTILRRQPQNQSRTYRYRQAQQHSGAGKKNKTAQEMTAAVKQAVAGPITRK
ncbi:hypothetical protein C7N83_13190 [Neisseria iguanae]|uniref:Uncharacterized protein n=1 Tax=Neisseria iguanae TaxID=90242 RepID=A0A2P7TX26_9NEIS|nr:hypothetical protein C7N83_13190 [Neisseria iguanae]